MLPILFTWRSFNIYTLGVLLGIGYLLAAFIIWRRLKEFGLKEEKVIDLIIILGFSALFFARLFYIIPNFKIFAFYFAKWLAFGRYPGFSYFGMVFGITIGSFWFARKQKWEAWKIYDEVIFGILPLFILAQIGCFLDGSGQGAPTTMPWGVFFPGSLLYRQPVSAFTAIILFFIWIFLHQIERHWRFWNWYKSKANGLLSLVFLGLFFASNFLLAFFKDLRLYWLMADLVINFLGLVSCGSLIYVHSGRKIFK